MRKTRIKNKIKSSTLSRTDLIAPNFMTFNLLHLNSVYTHTHEKTGLKILLCKIIWKSKRKTTTKKTQRAL